LEEALNSLVEGAMMHGADFCDVRLITHRSTNIRVENGIAKELVEALDSGISIRVLINGSWGFAAANSMEKRDMHRALMDAVSAAKANRGGGACVAETEAYQKTVKSPYKINPRDISIDEKVERILELEGEARSYSGKIKTTMLSYSDSEFREVICNSFGSFIDQTLTRIRVGMRVVAKEGANRQSAYRSVGKLAGFEVIEKIDPERFSIDAARTAVNLLKAKKAPAGRFTVLMDPGISGLFAHEAVGHNAEGDLVAFHESIIEGMKGRRIASEAVTMIDDATIEGAHGSYYFDSEGTPSRRKTIIENGILKGFMHGLESAALLGEEPTGNCRAAGHQSIPIVRMSNTFFAPGDYTFEELIEDVDVGVFVRGANWGYVYVERGQFTCNVEEAYMIRNGEIAEQLSNVSIGGLTLETLKNIEACSKDFELKLPGICGKSGQAMWVDAGGPYMRVRDVVVGGYRS